MKIIAGKSFRPALESQARYLVMCGGAGSGKSEFAARKIFYRCEIEGRHRFLVMRKIRRTLGESTVEVMRRVLAENKVAHEFNKSDLTINFAGPRGMNEILFMGLDDPEKIKSIKGITSIWLEETTEFTKEDFLQIDLRLRDPGPLYHQIMLTFNPLEAQARWLKDMFFGPVPNPDAFVHRSTVEDNPITEVRETYRKRLQALKAQDETMFTVYGLGEWAALAGQIFNWNVESLPPLSFDEVWYGGDFGYSVDPAGVVKIYRKADEFWLEEVLYKTGLTNQALAQEMKDTGVGKQVAYFDSAEPKSIEELRRADLNVQPCDKGPDSVRAGIDFLKSKKIHVVEGSVNLYREMTGYCWRKDKSGNPLPEPVKFNDHLMDAARYGIVTHMKHGEAFLGVVKHDVRPA
jgi:phage terminase large subunit